MKMIFYSILEFWLFTNHTDICGCFFPFIFVVIEYASDSAVENHFVGGDFNGMTSDPSFACGYECCLYNLLTETNLDRWNTSYGITSKISKFLYLMDRVCF